MDWYQDGLNADRNANDYKRIASTADANSEPVLNLAEGGGAVLVISPQ